MNELYQICLDETLDLEIRYAALRQMREIQSPPRWQARQIIRNARYKGKRAA